MRPSLFFPRSPRPPGAFVLFGLWVLLIVGGALGCGGSVPLRRTGALNRPELMDHPAIENAAITLLEAARAALRDGVAPDAPQRWMLSPLVTGDGDWEASVLCWDLASRIGRLRPVDAGDRLESVPAIQAWLRRVGSEAVVWVVTSRGRYRPSLGLTICSGTRSWSSAPVEVGIPRDEIWAWPFDPQENPPLARLDLDGGEAFFEWEGKVYVEDRRGARELSWHRGKRELVAGKLRPWKDFGRTWITRHQGLPEDPSPALSLLRRDLRLVLRDLDLPRGEGEIMRWWLSRGGGAIELPLRRATAEQVRGIQAAPRGWDERGTWLVLREAPGHNPWVELYAASLRKLPRPRERKENPRETIRVLCDVDHPFTLPGPAWALKETHELEIARTPPGVDWALTARWNPLFPWLSPLEFWQRGVVGLDAVRRGEIDPSMHVVRMCALEDEFPRWVARSARGPLALGDRAFWRRFPAIPLYGVARVDPRLPRRVRRTLAGWLAQLGPFELFGLDREDLRPRMPLTGDLRPPREDAGPAPSQWPLAVVDSLRERGGLRLSFCGSPGLLDPSPYTWRRELERRLRFLLEQAGVPLAPRSQGAAGPECPPETRYATPLPSGVDLARLILPFAEPRARMDALLTGLGLRERWRRDHPESDPSEVEEWLLDEGYLVPLWTEPGAVFIDRRLAACVHDSMMVLPDLREAVLVPEEELAPFDRQR